MELPHKYSTHANVLRGLYDAGHMWIRLGTKAARPELIAHGKALLAEAPRMLIDLQASLNRTITPSGSERGPRCVPTGADPPKSAHALPTGCLGDFRGYPELMYAAVLTRQQARHQSVTPHP